MQIWTSPRRLRACFSRASVYLAAELLPEGASRAQNNRCCRGRGGPKEWIARGRVQMAAALAKQPNTTPGGQDSSHTSVPPKVLGESPAYIQTN